MRARYDARRLITATARVAVLLVGTEVVGAASVSATSRCTVTWTAPGSGGAWTEPTNWTPVGKPPPNALVCLPSDRVVRVRLGPSTSVRADDGRGCPRRRRRSHPAHEHPHARRFRRDGRTRRRRRAVLGHGTGAYLGATGADATVAGGVHLVVHGRGAVVSGRVRLSGGSVVTAENGTYAEIGAAVTSDGAPGTLWDGATLTFVEPGRASFDVPARFTRAQVAGGTVALPQLVGAGADGTTDLSGFDLDRSVVRVPFPIRTLTAGAPVTLDHASVVVASTGRSAFSGLRRVRAPVLLDGTLDTGAALTVDAATGTSNIVLRQGSTLAAADVTLVDGGRLFLDQDTAVTLGPTGEGALSLGVGTTPRATLAAYGTDITGDLVQRNGSVDLRGGFRHPLRVTGSWTSTASARLRLSADGVSGDTAPMGVQVGGTVDLRGVLVLAATPSTPEIGYREVLVRAPAGVTTAFSTVSAPAGWAASTTATTIVATYTG